MIKKRKKRASIIVPRKKINHVFVSFIIYAYCTSVYRLYILKIKKNYAYTLEHKK